MMPPLPEAGYTRPCYIYNADNEICGHALPMLYYTADQMKAYGQACREAALEEAAQVCNGEQWRNSARPVAYIEAFNQGCGDCEAAIRRLK